MDKIDSLIKTLTEFKEELNKNMNASYGATTPNMTKEEMDKAASKVPQASPVVGIPAEQVKAAKIKNLQSKIDSGTYKPDASKIADKMLQKEELTCSENGQWNIVEKAVKSPDIKADDVKYGNTENLKGTHIKPAKYQGGDPKHADVYSGERTPSQTLRNSGAPRPHITVDAKTGKYAGVTSGKSK